ERGGEGAHPPGGGRGAQAGARDRRRAREEQPRRRRGAGGVARAGGRPGAAARARSLRAARNVVWGKVLHPLRHPAAALLSLPAAGTFPSPYDRARAQRNAVVALLQNLFDQGSRMPVTPRLRRLVRAALPAVLAVALAA